MKAEDLMIGDWVYNSFTNENYQIWPQFFSQMYHQDKEMKRDLADANIHPIPLTPEILEKNGFLENNVFEDNLGLGIFGNESLKCGLWNDAKVFVFDTYKAWTMTDIDGVPEGSGFYPLNRVGGILYVHQLQHALRLCGISKDITL